MIAGLESRQKDLRERIKTLDRKAFRRGMFDIGELSGKECDDYFKLNFRARIYDNEIMTGDDPAAIRNRVADILAELKSRDNKTFHGLISSNAEIADECKRILKAIGADKK